MLRLLPHLKHVHNSGFLSHCLTPVPDFLLPLPHIGQINPFDLSLVKKENGALFIVSCISLFVIVNLITPFFSNLMLCYRRFFFFIICSQRWRRRFAEPPNAIESIESIQFSCVIRNVVLTG